MCKIIHTKHVVLPEHRGKKRVSWAGHNKKFGKEPLGGSRMMYSVLIRGCQSKNILSVHLFRCLDREGEGEGRRA